MSDLVVPDRTASPARVERFVDVECPAVRQELASSGDVAAAHDFGRRLAALAGYIADKKLRAKVLREVRRTEVLIGQLIGPDVQQGSRPTLARGPKLNADERKKFRWLARHADRVEQLITDAKPKLSRKAILDLLAEDERAAERPTRDVPMDVRLGDFRDVLSDVSDADAIVQTDPPYPAEFLPLYDDLAAFAGKILRPGGLMAVMVGHHHLPDVIARLGSGPLPYRWTLAYLLPASNARIHARQINACWKPVLLYGSSELSIGSDVVTSPKDTAGEHHAWGQSLGGIRSLVNRVTLPGWHVVDPFMGAGTTALACVDSGRTFTGCDIDQSAYETTLRRLGRVA